MTTDEQPGDRQDDGPQLYDTGPRGFYKALRESPFYKALRETFSLYRSVPGEPPRKEES
jgi:hypothetical protein